MVKRDLIPLSFIFTKDRQPKFGFELITNFGSYAKFNYSSFYECAFESCENSSVNLLH